MQYTVKNMTNIGIYIQKSLFFELERL